MTDKKAVRITCVRCGKDDWHHSRMLCKSCYENRAKRGLLHEYERVTRPGDELMEEWAWLKSEGYTRRQAAERLGISKKTLEKAIERSSRKDAA